MADDFSKKIPPLDDLKVRFAPSPTGELHIGGARTALYNYLAARRFGGKFLLRIEDTDRERSSKENIEQIIEALDWLGLNWDGEIVFQSKREERHREAVSYLIEKGRAYYDPSTADDVRAWKNKHGSHLGYRGRRDSFSKGAVRLAIPDDLDEIVVSDLVRGEVAFPAKNLDDFVIARADGSPVYNLAVAVDDADMEIGMVIRGDDHLSNTQKQILVLGALEVPVPDYAHAPLIHGTDGKKLSKRENAASVQSLRDAGYLPGAVLNYLALLGWGPDDDQTIMRSDDLVEKFHPEDIKKSSAIFDEKKLRWLNGRYMRSLAFDDYLNLVAQFLGRAPDNDLALACQIVQEKAQTLDDVWPMISFLFESPEYDPKAWQKIMSPDSKKILLLVSKRLSLLDKFTSSSVERVLLDIVKELDLKPSRVYQPIRVAISGGTVSPGIFDSVSALGKKKTLERIEAALLKIS